MAWTRSATRQMHAFLREQCIRYRLELDDESLPCFVDFCVSHYPKLRKITRNELLACYDLFLEKTEKTEKTEKIEKRSSSTVPGFLFPNRSKQYIVYLSHEEALSPDFKSKLCEALPKGVRVTPEKPWTPLNTEQALKTSSMTLYREITPQKNAPTEIMFPSWDKSTLEASPKITSHSFVLTLEDLVKNTRERRKPDQKRLMGMSALDLYRKLNAVLMDKARTLHWCHIRGLCLNGSQDKENILPGTGGSNYFTLAYLELPVKALLEKDHVSEIKVRIQIQYHEQHRTIPQKIFYHMSWGNGREASFVGRPLSYKRPTRDDVQIAETLFSLTKTPPKAKKPSRLSALNIDFGCDETSGEENAGRSLPSFRV